MNNVTVFRFSISIFYLVMVKIATVNLNGLNNVSKFQNVIYNFSSKNLDFICVQETHWSDEFVQSYNHLWDGAIIYSNGVSGYQGCAIFISKRYAKCYSGVFKDADGRLVGCQIELDEALIHIVCAYAPNDPTSRLKFLGTVSEKLHSLDNVVLCGDFNDVMDSYVDRSNNMQAHGRNSKLLPTFVTENCLYDIWRRKNPSKNVFTRRQLVLGSLKQSRIDYIFLTSSLLIYSIYCFISHTSLSDHSFVTLILNFDDCDRGPGLWVLNNRNLKDFEYNLLIKNLVKESNVRVQCF